MRPKREKKRGHRSITLRRGRRKAPVTSLLAPGASQRAVSKFWNAKIGALDVANVRFPYVRVHPAKSLARREKTDFFRPEGAQRAVLRKRNGHFDLPRAARPIFDAKRVPRRSQKGHPNFEMFFKTFFLRPCRRIRASVLHFGFFSGSFWSQFWGSWRGHLRWP